MLLVSEPLTPGGIASYTRNIMEGLSAAGISHPLITSASVPFGVLPESEQRHTEVVNTLFWTFVRPLVFRKLIVWARDHDVALIHGLSAFTAPLCSRLADALDVPFIVAVHHYQTAGGLRHAHRCAALITVSESLRENLVNDADVPKDLVRLIPAGVRVPQDAPPPAASPASVPLVSSFGRLLSRKDFPTFLKAARLIVDKRGADCSFVISGDGPEEPALRALARGLGIAKQVAFCHGAAAQEQLLRETDVYVQCARTEGFGSVALQAMAHGVPVVASSTGGLITLVRDGETGFLVPVGNPEAVAARVLELLANDELRLRMGRAARHVAFTDYNLDRMMERTVALYEEVLSAAPAAG